MTNTDGIPASSLDELRVDVFDRMLQRTGEAPLRLLAELSWLDVPRDLVELLVDECELAAPFARVTERHVPCHNCERVVVVWPTSGEYVLDQDGHARCPSGEWHVPSV